MKRKVIETLNWWACWIIASGVAFLGFLHVERALLPQFQLPGFYYGAAYLLAVASPACLAVAWMRFQGVPWRRAVLLFLFVPLGTFILWYAVNVVPFWIAT